MAGTLASLLLIIGIGALLVRHFAPAQKNNPTYQTPSLLQSEQHQNIDILGKEPYEVSQLIGASLAQTPQPKNLTDIFYTRGNLRASFSDVLDALDISDIPTSIKNELIPGGIINEPVFMHGIMGLGATKAHILILPVSHYDIAFAGFKEWEPTLFKDLGIFMDVPQSVLKAKLTADTFHDEMISNKNVRVFRYNDLMLGYFFLNEHAVVIVDNPDSIPEILSRYANSQIYKVGWLLPLGMLYSFP
jgi:hypothetical protein